MANDGTSPLTKRSTPRRVGSVVYLVLTALLPAAVVIDVVNHHWYYLFVALVISAFQVPMAVWVTRQSGPAAKLIFPIVLVALLGLLMVSASISA